MPSRLRPTQLLVGLLALCSAVAFAGEVQQPRAKEQAEQQLTVLNWSEYLDPELIAAFEEKFSAKVVEVYFENDEHRDDLVQQTNAVGFDVVLVDGVTLNHYARRGWLAQLDESRLPNLRHIDPKWRSVHKDTEAHGVPYFWGTLGIAYRSDLVSEEITSWKQFFSPPEELRGRIGMIRDSRDTVGMALAALGHSPNSTDPNALAEAERLLLAQKPFVNSYSYLSLSDDSAMVTGDLWAAMIYSGDALALQEHNEDITYVVPEEGTIIWVDYFTVMSSSRNKDLAWKFINFINQPENAAKNADYVYYATPNTSAERHLSQEFLSDDTIYPSDELLRRSETYAQLPPRALRRYVTILARVLQ